MTTRRRVLVLRALGLGDLLTAVPALRALRRGQPDAEIVVAGPAALAPLLPAGLVDEIRQTAPLAPIDPDLAGADLAVNLHGRGPQSTELLAATRPSRLVAFGVTSAWRADEHEVQRWCRLVTEAGFPADPLELDLEPPSEPPLVRDAILVHPGAALPSRRWPPERWAAVACGLAAPAAPVVLTGGPDERELAEQVAGAAGLPDGAVLAGRTTPSALAAVVAAARLLVSADTGVAHLATALGTPSVTLFGPVSPALWGPPPHRPQHRPLWAGRSGDNFFPTTDPGLLELRPDDVLREARDLLAAGGRREPARRRTVLR